MARMRIPRWIVPALWSSVALITTTVRADAPGNDLVGRHADGTVLLTTDQKIRPAGQQVEFPGRPVAVAVHPNGKTAALLNGYGNALVVVDLQAGTVKQQFADAGSAASFAGLVYSRDGR